MLEQLAFSGEVRSLAGPVKGEGSFVVAGQRYPYRITTSRIADDGGAKVRFAVDPVGQPVAAEADVSIWVENGLPRFEGTVQLTRAVGRAPAGAGSMIIEPWRVTSHNKGDSAAAVLEQIEFQYGPDERAIKLRGGAGLRFGRHHFFARISPKKTVEGAVAELLASTVFFAIVGLLVNISFPHNLIIGLLIGIFAQVGDLVESQIKRTAGVKDASHLIPGHGGILDRIDSLLLVGVVVYYYVTSLHLA